MGCFRGTHLIKNCSDKKLFKKVFVTLRLEQSVLFYGPITPISGEWTNTHVIQADLYRAKVALESFFLQAKQDADNKWELGQPNLMKGNYGISTSHAVRGSVASSILTAPLSALWFLQAFPLSCINLYGNYDVCALRIKMFRRIEEANAVQTRRCFSSRVGEAFFQKKRTVGKPKTYG